MHFSFPCTSIASLSNLSFIILCLNDVTVVILLGQMQYFGPYWALPDIATGGLAKLR